MKSKYNFDGPKYSTARIASDISLELQVFLWTLIETRAQTGNADYLQVFALRSEGPSTQVITHTQEQPPMEETHSITMTHPFTGNIWVIDDVLHATMIFPEEY